MLCLLLLETYPSKSSLLFWEKSTSQTGVIVFVSRRPFCSRFGGIFRQAELPRVLTDLDGARGDPGLLEVVGVADLALPVRPRDAIGQLPYEANIALAVS